MIGDRSISNYKSPTIISKKGIDMQKDMHKKMKNKAKEAEYNKISGNKLSFRPAHTIKRDLRAK